MRWFLTSKPLGSIAGLAVGGTALAQLVLFRMLRLHGPSRTSLVTYLLPPVALFYGVIWALVALLAIAFSFGPVGHADRYMPAGQDAQRS